MMIKTKKKYMMIMMINKKKLCLNGMKWYSIIFLFFIRCCNGSINVLL